MKTQPTTRGLFGAALLCLAFAGSAHSSEKPEVRLHEARFVRLSTGEGLSQDTVYTIVQDRQRFVWFGTEEGLNRYDGYSFKVFKNIPGDPTSLASNWVYRVYEDRSHRLWVGTLGGLSLFDVRTETFRNFRRPGEALTGFDQKTVTSILEDREGNLWVGTLGGGLSRVDPETGEFVKTYREGPDATSLSHDQVQRLYENNKGEIWVGTTRGLNLFDPAQGTFTRYMHSDDPTTLGGDWVWDMAEDAHGRLWVATSGGGLSRLDRATGRFRRYQKKGGRIPNDWATSVLVDRAGVVWAGTDGGGLLRYDPTADRFIAYTSRPQDSSSLSKNVVRSIYEDVQGNLWVGAFKGGISMLPRDLQNFSFYAHDPSRPDSLSPNSAVNEVIEDREGGIWIGTTEGGLNRFDRDAGTFAHFRNQAGNPRSLSSDTVTALYQDRGGRLWVGTHGGGLDLYDPKTRSFEKHQQKPGVAGTLGNDYVWVIAEEPGPGGALWVGTNGGLDRLDLATRRFTHYGHDPADEGSLSDHAVRALLVEDNGDLWVGTLGGLDFLKKGSSKFIRLRNDPQNPETLSNNAVVGLLRDASGRTWVGTLGGGLNLFDPATRRFTAFRVQDGLPSDSIYSVCEDARGHLWLGTNTGLARFNPRTHEVKNFGLSNGLRSLQFGLGGCAPTRDGRLLFGSADGLYLFDPKKVKTDTYVPPVVFTGFQVYSQAAPQSLPVSAVPEIRLAYSQNMFTVGFAALDFTVPRGNGYAYRVEGFRSEWTPLGSKHELTFTNLDPGAYELQVRASNSDGVWNEAGALLRVSIAPPFWATWWFRSLLALAFAGLLVMAHRFRVRQLRARERELTRRVDEAMARVKVLRGLLPMCAWCKKVRDDRGYWNQIEAYLAQHSEADFSHGICPECARRIAPTVS
jgi:ligand-binding sensor domain-containing protein